MSTDAQLSSDPVATPKTDAAEVWGHDVVGAEHYVPADFARAQERRIAELLKDLTDLRRGIEEHATDTVWCGPAETASERIYSIIDKAQQP